MGHSAHLGTLLRGMTRLFFICFTRPGARPRQWAFFRQRPRYVGLSLLDVTLFGRADGVVCRKRLPIFQYETIIDYEEAELSL